MQNYFLKYRYFIPFLIFYFIISYQLIQSQVERETRAVWVATNHRLDWPPQTYDQEKQKKALEDIFNNVKSKNLNTVFFQVRSNGTVLFKSSKEPFSQYITGKMNGKANYDPLEYAIELAHNKGLEIHAWVNCVIVFSGNDTIVMKNSNHIVNKKPEWIVEDYRDGVKAFWLDPGLPEVRNYIAEVITEMVENYDIDGVQLDYIRYPGKIFDDDFSYGIYGKDISRDEWRRNNITDLIALINKKVKAVKPYIKLGATPIGVYKNQEGMFAWEGYTEVYQDSRGWLKKGILDYVAPQIYWGMDENPRFDVVAKEWIDNSYGRNVVLGIGAYKENVRKEMDAMILYTRTINAGGVAFYRYSNIKDYDFKNFDNKTYPATMAWLDGIYPEAPQNLTYKIENLALLDSNSHPNLIRLEWEIREPNSNDSIRYFALYSLPHPGSELLSEFLFDVIPSEKTSITLAVKPKKINYYFTLKSVSKLWNESIESSNVVEVKFNELNLLANCDEGNRNPMLLIDTDGSAKILLFSNIDDKIEVYGKDDIKLQKLLTEDIFTGKNVIGLNEEISKFKLLKIVFKSSNREVELKLF